MSDLLSVLLIFLLLGIDEQRLVVWLINVDWRTWASGLFVSGEHNIHILHCDYLLVQLAFWDQLERSKHPNIII